MCLILAAWRTHPDYPCIVAANRDEYFARPTAVAAWWSDRPRILGGRDLEAGGTWLGLTRDGRFGALTNFRGPQRKRAHAPSRGALVITLLEAGGTVQGALAQLRQVSADYDGFNVLFSDGERLAVYESETGVGRELGPGVYGLSNHLLDTPWPKVQKAKARLQAALGSMHDPSSVLDLLRDDRPALDDELPRTGVSLEWERLLSSAFVRGEDYGTRSSTLIRIDRRGTAWFDEWTWRPDGELASRHSASFAVAAAR